MLIEYTNLKSRGTHFPQQKSAVIASFILFLILPLAIALLSILASTPTGTLLSPLPQTVLSQEPAETALPIIASDTPPSTSPAVVAASQSNSSDHIATIPVKEKEIKIEDQKINTDTQVLIIPRKNDSSVYFVKSKGDGFFTLASDSISDTERSVDYQIVNP